ncbi:MAG: hypothetical protein AAFO07_03590 [Bacteroidota bacterium]
MEVFLFSIYYRLTTDMKTLNWISYINWLYWLDFDNKENKLNKLVPVSELQFSHEL